MSDEQFEAIMGRLDGLQTEIETFRAEVTVSMSTLMTGQVNLFNMMMAHVNDRRSHGDAA